MSHSPLPWTIDATVALGPYFIVSPNSPDHQSLVCAFEVAKRSIDGKPPMSRETLEANAKLIVTAVNHHKKLVDALQFIITDMHEFGDHIDKLTGEQLDCITNAKRVLCEIGDEETAQWLDKLESEQ